MQDGGATFCLHTQTYTRIRDDFLRTLEQKRKVARTDDLLGILVPAGAIARRDAAVRRCDGDGDGDGARATPL